MSVSADEMVEHHRRATELYAEVARRHPNATVQRIGDRDVMLSRGDTNDDRLMVVGDDIVPYERVEVDGAWLPVVGGTRRKKPTAFALEHLREKFPEAYAGLVAWMNT